MMIQQTNLSLSRIQAEAVLAAWLGHPVVCTKIQRLHGGMINTVLRLEFDWPPFDAVIKLNIGETGFGDEKRALSYLHDHTRFPCPQVYLQEDSTRLIPYAFLLLEMVPGVCLSEIKLSEKEYAEIDRQLAEILLELHSHTRLHYGAIDEQPGPIDWLDVFLPRLDEARCAPEVENLLPESVLDKVDGAIHLAELILKDQGTPTLIHGDIWAGNLIVIQADDTWQLAGIVDPGIYYADVEAELAYLEVFDNQRRDLFDAYTTHRPLRQGYTQRRLFYWLHTALVHVKYFGQAYYREFTARTAEAIHRSIKVS